MDIQLNFMSFIYIEGILNAIELFFTEFKKASTHVVFIWTSIIVWGLVPVRQYKSTLFYSFLILGLTDILGVIFYYLKYYDTGALYCASVTLYLLSLILNKAASNNKKQTIIVGVSLLLGVISAIAGNNYYFYMLFAQFAAFFVAMSIFYYFMLEAECVHIFFFNFLMYQLINLIKFVYTFSPARQRMIYFYTLGLLQILFGLYFLIFTEKNKKMMIKAKGKYV